MIVIMTAWKSATRTLLVRACVEDEDHVLVTTPIVLANSRARLVSGHGSGRLVGATADPSGTEFCRFVFEDVNLVGDTNYQVNVILSTAFTISSGSFCISTRR